MNKYFLNCAMLLTFMVSCNKSETKTATSAGLEKTEQAQSAEKFSIDSLRVGDSVVLSPTLTVDYRSKILLFTGLEKQVLDSLYKGELFDKEAVLPNYSRETVQQNLNKRMQEYFAEQKKSSGEYMPDFAQTWNENSEMEFFSQLNDYLTVNYTGDGFAGGAHGYAYDVYKVVDLKNQKKIVLQDIVEVSKVNWKEVLLKNIMEKGILFDQNISYNQNFYFDQNHITFVYGQYEIAPYAAGIIEITVPFTDIPGALKPDFRKRMSVE